MVERSISFQEYKAFSDYTNSQLIELIAGIDKNVFGYLLENIKIRTRVDSIDPGPDHDIVHVRVGVDFDHVLLADNLSKYWKVRTFYKSREDEHRVSMVNVEADKNSLYPTSVNRLAFEYMTNQQLQLIVSIGEQQVVVPVTYRTRDRSGTCEVGKPSKNNKNYCFASIQYESNKGFLPTSKGNPVAFKVPKIETRNLVVSSRLKLKTIDTSELSYSMYQY
jgi:hypothetical protein